MKRLLILGGGVEQVAAVERAKRKGIATVVMDMNKNAPAAAVTDEFYTVSTRDVEGIYDFLDKYDKKIDGVMTIASDIPHMVSRVAEKLNVMHIPVSVADTAVNKFQMKEVLSKAGVNVPPYRMVANPEEVKEFADEYGYPVVIKPLDNSGARGVLLITPDIDLNWAFEESKKNGRNRLVMVERYIEGLQISNEGIMYNDKFFITGFADRNYDRLLEFAPNIIEDGAQWPSVVSEKEENMINAEFEKAVRALGINWGPGKGDMILGSDGRAYVVEIAARLSGGNFCYDQVPMGTGVDIVDAYIDMTVGNEIDTECFTPKWSKGVAQRYFFPGTGKIKQIKGVDKAKAMKWIRKIDIWVKEGDSIMKQENHAVRTGYLIAVAPTRDEAVAAANLAINTIEFIFE